MPYKDPEKSRAAIRKHYYANKDYYLAKNYKRRRELRDYIHELKNSTPCTDCGVQYPYYVMDFDHLEDKVGAISAVLKSGSNKKMAAELLKCEVVCANCHRVRTYNRIKHLKIRPT